MQSEKESTEYSDKTNTQQEQQTGRQEKPKIPQLEEGYVGRDWKKFFTIIGFFFVLLITWYVLKAISLE